MRNLGQTARYKSAHHDSSLPKRVFTTTVEALKYGGSTAEFGGRRIWELSLYSASVEKRIGTT